MKFNRFKKLITRKVELQEKGALSGEKFLEISDINKQILNSCIQETSHYFNITFKDFEKAFIKQFSEYYQIEDNKVCLFNKTNINNGLKSYCLLIENENNAKIYVLTENAVSLTLRLPLDIPTKNFDDCDGERVTDWTMLFSDYPKVKDILWNIVEDNLAQNKSKQISLIKQMIEKNKKEIEILKDPEKISIRIATLNKDNEQKLKDIKDLKSGDFQIDVLMRK